LVMAGFDTVRECANAVADIIKAGIVPAGLEMMDKFAIEASEAFAHAGYPLDAEALLLCELDGEVESVEAELEEALKVLSGASTIRVSENEAERLLLWQGRKSAFPAVGRLAPDYYCMDGTIPKRHLASVLEKINELSVKYQLRVANVFHAGDGNLHPLILYEPASQLRSIKQKLLVWTFLSIALLWVVRLQESMVLALKNWMPCVYNTAPPSWRFFTKLKRCLIRSHCLIRVKQFQSFIVVQNWEICMCITANCRIQN